MGFLDSSFMSAEYIDTANVLAIRKVSENQKYNACANDGILLNEKKMLCVLDNKKNIIVLPTSNFLKVEHRQSTNCWQMTPSLSLIWHYQLIHISYICCDNRCDALSRNFQASPKRSKHFCYKYYGFKTIGTKLNRLPFLCTATNFH